MSFICPYTYNRRRCSWEFAATNCPSDINQECLKRHLRNLPANPVYTPPTGFHCGGCLRYRNPSCTFFNFRNVMTADDLACVDFRSRGGYFP